MFSCYWTPHCLLSAFQSLLNRLDRAVRLVGGPNVIVVGDFNAKSSEWGSDVNNDRGAALGEFAASLGLAVCNVGTTPTFQRREHLSVLDATFSRGPLCEVEAWTVITNVESRSDHCYISIRIRGSARTPDSSRELSARTRGWAVWKLDRALATEHQLDWCCYTWVGQTSAVSVELQTSVHARRSRKAAGEDAPGAHHLEVTGGLVDNQFGFRRGRGTVDAIRTMLEVARRAGQGAMQNMRLCALINVDVQDAFNTTARSSRRGSRRTWG